jgi:serine phosphatase RsbU (regulator of sigma subunit)
VFCAVADLTSGTLTYASAAHPPALLVAADGTAAWLGDGRSVPLASVPVGPRPQATVPLAPGNTLVAYTDGLIEHRGVPLDDSLERLRATVAAAADRSPTRLVDLVIAELSPPEVREDDLAVLAYRAPGAAPSA